MECLKHRGPHGNDVLPADRVALGHCHFWTTPEEQGERQPLSLAGLPFRIVLDGRLDNREELFARLSIPPADGKLLSDAALVLHAYDRWGEKCFEYFIGEYALVIFDERRTSLVCARDSLGDRTLFYSVHGSQVVIASEARAVAEANGLVDSLNENAVAHYFARKAPQDGQTLYKDVFELLPARAMLVDVSGQRVWRYWQPDLSRKIHGRSNEDYAGEFRSLLEESVRCRLRSNAPVGVLMSGGLDSTSVACLAARLIAPNPLTTISYVFDELHDCDERQYIDAVSTKWNTRSIQIPCDDAWPLKDWNTWPHNPNYPEGNPYRLLKERAYARARQEGLRVVLTGGFGDHLYGAGVEWLADLMVEGRFMEAGRELGLYLRYAGLHWLLDAGYLQRVARRWLNVIPSTRRIKLKRPAPPWMTDSMNRQVLEISPESERDLFPYGNLLGSMAALSSSAEIFHASCHGIELRHPYRDRRLVEYVLSLPADQLYYHNTNKRVLRSAMKDILPEVVRTRLQPTSLGALFLRGLNREKERLDANLRASGETLYGFIRSDWLWQHWNVSKPSNMDDSDTAVIWSCAAYLKWKDHTLPGMAI